MPRRGKVSWQQPFPPDFGKWPLNDSRLVAWYYPTPFSHRESVGYLRSLVDTGTAGSDGFYEAQFVNGQTWEGRRWGRECPLPYFAKAASSYAFIGTGMSGALSTFTMSGWVRLEEYGTLSCIIGNYTANTNTWFMFVDSSGLSIDGRDGANVYRSSGYAPGVELKKWHYLTVSRGDSGGTLRSRAYVDGGDGFSESTLGTAPGTSSANMRFSLADSLGSGMMMTGSIDSFRVYNVELTTDEVYQLYREELQGYPKLLPRERKRVVKAAAAAATSVGRIVGRPLVGPGLTGRGLVA